MLTCPDEKNSCAIYFEKGAIYFEQRAIYFEQVPYILNNVLYILNNVPYHGLVISSVIQVTNPVQ